MQKLCLALDIIIIGISVGFIRVESQYMCLPASIGAITLKHGRIPYAHHELIYCILQGQCQTI